jgi:hypothetical protein
MLRRLILISVSGGLSLAFASILPEGFEGGVRKSVKPLSPPDQMVWEEYGLQEAEEAVYERNGASFSIAAYRLKDPTCALGVFQWLRPANSKSRELTWPTMKPVAAEAPGRLLILVGNYFLDIRGIDPDQDTLSQLFVALPKVDQAALPTLTGFLPARNLVPNSERYILGPATLAKFEPRLRPSQIGFHMSAEAQTAKYQTPDGAIQLLLISYPTPHIARARMEALEKIPGVTAKRSGTLVGLILPPANPDAAELVLAGVNYLANITWNENPNKPKENWADLLIAIFILCGVLILVCVAGGFLVAGARMLSRRLVGTKGSEDPMILLHLSDQ